MAYNCRDGWPTIAEMSGLDTPKYTRWKDLIINSFIVVNGKRNSNGPIESLNSRIKKLISHGNGFKSFERFRNKTMFSLNKNEPIKY